jgi:hypothetical protein
MRAGALVVVALTWMFTNQLCSGTALAEPMQFVLQPPHQPEQVFGNAWGIFADGDIEGTSAAGLTKVMEENRIPPNSTVYFNSPGGSLFGGMELGLLIRKYGLFTEVAKRGPTQTSYGFREYAKLPGVCLSACSLAYIGGVFRWVGNSKSVYGVHRFYGDSSLDADKAQIASSVIIQYIRDMGVDPALFTEMTKAGREEVNIIPWSKLGALNVVNSGQGRTEWSIETTGDDLYVKGQRNTSQGINKFMVVCTNGRLSLYVIFDPIGRDQEVLGLEAQSLMIDHKAIPISHLRQRPVTLQNGWINAMYNLSSDLIDKIKTAKTVGIAFQALYGAPTYMGFDGMELGDGRQKLAGLLAACH